MADEVTPQLFRKSPEAVVTYSYTDVATGTGIITLYGFTAKTSAATTYRLTSSTPYSADIKLAVAAEATSDWDFDLAAFSSPRRIKGTAIITGYLDIYNNTSAVTITIRKVSGVTETDLGTAVTPNYTVGAAHLYPNFCLPVVVTETHFNRGDFLRINIALAVGAGNGSEMGCDPMNRSAAAAEMVTTQLKADVPFVID